MRPGFWRDKRAFITGHTGFKGSWLCLMLHSLGARVHGYALDAPTQPNLFSLARVADVVESTKGDIRDLESLSECMRAFAPEVVFHMAAQSVVLTSYEDPPDTYSTNVMGTVNLLEAVRRLKRPCVVVNVTTDKCYENKGWVWGYRESDELGGHDPYSNSKACAELVGQCYRDSFFPTSRFSEHGVALASARAGNVVGGGDWTFRQLVPETIAAFLRSEGVSLRHPQAVRPWQHVLDCLGGYMHLTEALSRDAQTYAGGWNFGPTDADSRTVSYVVDALASHWGIERPWEQDKGVHASEAQQLRLDVNKAANLLGWRCQLPIDEALRWVATWYRDYHSGADALSLCNEQISQYVARLGRGTEMRNDIRKERAHP
jgi:CDP-glucose 4,6-dehydratase